MIFIRQNKLASPSEWKHHSFLPCLFSPFYSYLSIYGLILLGATICYTTASGLYVFGALRASRTIHAKLIDAVLGTTLRWVPQCPYLVHESFLLYFRWLDTTPTSRVITRVTQDIRACKSSFFLVFGAWVKRHSLYLVDGPISNTFTWLIEISATMLIKFVAVVYLTPIFMIPGTVIAVVGAWLGHVYMKAQIAIKREMSNAKAPVMGHFGAAVAGISSSVLGVVVLF